MNFRLAVALVLVSLTFWQPSALAQVNEKFADMGDEIASIRSVAQSDRKSIVDDAMLLTPQESTAFWPVYNKYRAEATQINDKLVKVVTDYAAQRDSLTDAQAGKLINDYLAFEQDLLNLRKKYLKEFGAALPMTKVARFYQIENKLDAVQRVGIASQVPLTK
jgi:hypothetical protein